MSVARASAIMIGTLVASRVLGWLRSSVIGATFGGTSTLDAFIAAFKIPDAIFGLLVAGALASAVIPLFTGYLARERQQEAWRIASSVVNALLLLLIGASALVPLPELTFRRPRSSFTMDLQHPGVRDVLRLAGPRTIALGAVQIVFFVDTNLASSMPAGSLVALNYAFQLLMLPLGVFSIAISAAIFPALSHYASLGQVGRMRDAVQQAIRWILFLTLPTAILMIVLRRPIVNLLFQYGSFGPEARELTQAAFLFYSLGLPGPALVQSLALGYFHCRCTQTRPA